MVQRLAILETTVRERTQNQDKLLDSLQAKIDKLIEQFELKIREQDKRIDSLKTQILTISGGLSGIIGTIMSVVVNALKS